MMYLVVCVGYNENLEHRYIVSRELPFRSS